MRRPARGDGWCRRDEAGFDQRSSVVQFYRCSPCQRKVVNECVNGPAGSQWKSSTKETASSLSQSRKESRKSGCRCSSMMTTPARDARASSSWDDLEESNCRGSASGEPSPGCCQVYMNPQATGRLGDCDFVQLSRSSPRRTSNQSTTGRNPAAGFREGSSSDVVLVDASQAHGGPSRPSACATVQVCSKATSV